MPRKAAAAEVRFQHSFSSKGKRVVAGPVVPSGDFAIDPMNYFEVFGLPKVLDFDLEALEKTFHELSRKYHPDYFTTAPAGRSQKALRMTATLNDAYRTLRHPVRRVEYLLELEGFKPDGSKVPKSFLMEVFEINEQLEEVKAGTASKEQIAAFEARNRGTSRKLWISAAKQRCGMGHAVFVGCVRREAEATTIEADRNPVGVLIHQESAAGVGGNVVMPQIVGIDLGTTNSLVAIVENGTPRVIPGPDGSNLVPSIIYFEEQGKVLVGNAARKR